MFEFKTGDKITAKVIGKPYFHVGLIVVENDTINIVHNTPSEYNVFGGSVVIDTIVDFQKTRLITKVEHTNLTAEFIEKKVVEYQNEPFNLFFFNCEHFVNLLITGKKSSPQMQQLYFVGGASLIGIYYLSNKK